MVSGFARTSGWEGTKTIHKNIWMKMCPDGMDPKYDDSETGIVIFHELMHMTSIVSDHVYSKKGMVELAKNDPYSARLNADSYTMYIA